MLVLIRTSAQRPIQLQTLVPWISTHFQLLSLKVASQNTMGDDLQQAAYPYRSIDNNNLLLFKSANSFGTTSRAIDFASAVRKDASQDSEYWKYERNGNADVSVGSSRIPRLQAISFSGHGKTAYGGDRLQSYGAARATLVWLETGEAVANMYSELREEARDHARLRNAFFDQEDKHILLATRPLQRN